MELNIQAVADAKIQEMHKSGKVKDAIEKGVETLILKAINDALDGYSIRRDIEKQISDSVSGVVKDIGFSGYNGFIAEKVKEITEGVMRDDVAQKIQKVFNDMLIVRHDGIKLSEVINRYRKYLFESVEESDKWDRHNFTCSVDERIDGKWTHIYVVLSEEPGKSKYDADIALSFCIYGEKTESDIAGVHFGGHKLGDGLRLGVMTELESLIANLYFNKTPVILDVESVDDSDYYDIDD